MFLPLSFILFLFLFSIPFVPCELSLSPTPPQAGVVGDALSVQVYWHSQVSVHSLTEAVVSLTWFLHCRGHAQAVHCLAFSGALLLSAGADHTIRIWDTEALARGCQRVLTDVPAAVSVSVPLGCMMFSLHELGALVSSRCNHWLLDLSSSTAVGTRAL